MSVMRRFLDLSNAHLSNQDRACLDGCAGRETGEVSCAVTPYGWFVYAHDERPKTPEISDALWALMSEARRQSAEYPLFDRDAATLEGFPCFDRLDDAPRPQEEALEAAMMVL